MTLDALSTEEVARLKDIIDDGIQTKQDIRDLREGLSETIKAIADEVDIKSRTLNKAINAAFKNNLGEQQEEHDEIAELLKVTGHGS